MSQAFSGAGDGVDFVVVGLGLGALMMLAGFALRDLGPWLFGFSTSDNVLPEFETVKTTIRKQTLASIGTAIATAGTGLAIVTCAALLARTEDELGTIVVGMSLALAAVGVGAWTYDAIRRYRAAMDMVTHQEQAVVARYAPAASAPAKSLTTRPGKDAPSDEDVDLVAGGAEETPDEIERDLEPVADEIEDEAISNLDEPEDDAIAREFEEYFDTQPASESDDQPVAANEPVSTSEATPEPEPSVSTSQDAVEPKFRKAPEEPPPGDRSGSSASAARWSPFNRPVVTPPEPVRKEEFTELPPLPEFGDDTLIEEAVRFDIQPSDDRKVPSWLFDDLETDINKAGAPKPEDPVDQFRGSQPVQRGSALDRILAGDQSADGSDDDDDSDQD